MSGMSSMLCILLNCDIPSRHEPNEKEERPLAHAVDPGFWMVGRRREDGFHPISE